MRRIKMNQGYSTVVDNEDYKLASMYHWYIHKVGKKCRYARGYLKGRRSSGLVYLHRLLLVVPEVDHINGNGLDNRRANPRECNRSQNSINRSGKKIAWKSNRKLSKPWSTEVRKDGKRYKLGYFKTKEEAVRAYKAKAKELYGEFYVNSKNID